MRSFTTSKRVFCFEVDGKTYEMPSYSSTPANVFYAELDGKTREDRAKTVLDAFHDAAPDGLIDSIDSGMLLQLVKAWQTDAGVEPGESPTSSD